MARVDKERAIAAAAYALLAERGYGATSMLAIAKRARASNETLYRWYGDKAGLMRALIAQNAAEAEGLLTAAIAEGRPPRDTVAALGPVLLRLLLGERAIAINRAAAADPTGELGRLLTAAGRARIAPLIGEVFLAARAAGELRFSEAGAAVALYLDQLVGDLQIRRAIGAVPEPTPAEIDARAAEAARRTWILLGVNLCD